MLRSQPWRAGESTGAGGEEGDSPGDAGLIGPGCDARAVESGMID
jgi:hypothetical protein